MGSSDRPSRSFGTERHMLEAAGSRALIATRPGGQKLPAARWMSTLCLVIEQQRGRRLASVPPLQPRALLAELVVKFLLSCGQEVPVRVCTHRVPQRRLSARSLD